MIALKKVLVATDFGEAAEAALDYGREFARTFGASLQVLNVVDNVLMRVGGAEAFLGVYPDVQREVDEAARRQLDQCISDEDRRTLGAKAVAITSNATAAAIVGYAADEKIDLIIMGTHGHGTIAHLLLGSVAEKVVRMAPCPVLTVRHPEQEFLRPDALQLVAHA